MTRRKISCILLAVFILTACLPVSAREVTFSKKFVDSNQWTYVTSATSESWDVKEGAVYIGDMFASDGSYAGYQNVWVKSDDNPQVLAVRRAWVNVPFRVGMYNKKLYAMGHNPAIDCLITGYWNVH